MKKTIKDFDLNNKRVIIRCDFNVPIKDGIILDDNRIKESLKTINYALDNNAKIILLSHLGRVKTDNDKKDNTLLPVSKRLSELLGVKVNFINETRGSVIEEVIKNMEPKDIVMLENTRYEDVPNKKESNNDEKLGKYWASLGDIFINDAFGTAHRTHASNVGIASNIPSGIGFLIQKELKMLGDVLNEPKRPYVVIAGGAKMHDKIKIIDKLIKKADYILLGGGIANTFLVAKGYDLKKSVYDEESVSHAKELLKKYDEKIILPLDGYSSSSYSDGLKVNYYKLDNVEDGEMILDIGPETIKLFSKYILKAKTVFWNGPVGVSEFKNFEYGTKKMCEVLKPSDANVVFGGGDSAAAVIRFGYKNSFSHVSTGGGASMEFIEGKILPAIAVIEEKSSNYEKQKN